MISDLNGSLRSRQFLTVANERTCFASCACVKSTELFTRLKRFLLLTKKLLMFLSRLNEINGGCEKQVSGSF